VSDEVGRLSIALMLEDSRDRLIDALAIMHQSML